MSKRNDITLDKCTAVKLQFYLNKKKTFHKIILLEFSKSLSEEYFLNKFVKSLMKILRIFYKSNNIEEKIY